MSCVFVVHLIPISPRDKSSLENFGGAWEGILLLDILRSASTSGVSQYQTHRKECVWISPWTLQFRVKFFKTCKKYTEGVNHGTKLQLPREWATYKCRCALCRIPVNGCICMSCSPIAKTYKMNSRHPRTTVLSNVFPVVSLLAVKSFDADWMTAYWCSVLKFIEASSKVEDSPNSWCA